MVELPKLPKLPDQARAELHAAELSERTVFHKVLAPYSGKCPNCAGIGYLWFQFVKAGPLEFVASPKSVVTYAENGWYVVDSRVYPCPVCTDPHERIAYLWDHAGLEPDEHEWRLDFFEGMQGKLRASEVARRYLEQIPHPNGLVTFFGSNGVGKTGFLKSIVAACIRAGVSAHYTRAEDILRQIRATFGSTGISELEMHTSYGRFQLLAIDEVDQTSNTNWSRSALMSLLDTRYNRRGSQCTLLATNREPGKLPKELDYLASRIRDGERIRVEGEDLRGVEMNQKEPGR
jgi:DNA replication protein DnaC